MSRTLRLGLVSTARINRAILGGAALSEHVDVVAVASRDSQKASAYAAEHGIAGVHGSYEALLADPDVDAVYISLPNGLHHAWTMRALAAGKHVLCEKPYTRRPDDVDEAFDAADAAGLVLMEAFMYRHHPQTLHVAGLVEEGLVGRLLAIRALFSFTLTDLGNVRAQSGLDGGALMDIGCYCVSGARLLAGEPLQVSAEQVVGTTGVDMAFFGTMRHADDVVSQFEASFLVQERQRLEVIGSEATLVVEAPWRPDLGEGVTLARRDGTVEQIAVERADAYHCQLDELAAAVAEGRPGRIGRADALGQARAIDALYRAAASGTAVAL